VAAAGELAVRADEERRRRAAGVAAAGGAPAAEARMAGTLGAVSDDGAPADGEDADCAVCKCDLWLSAVVVAGGVAANAAVRATLQASARAHGFGFAAPPLRYCTDNAAMIALAGAERLALGLTDGLDAVARPRWPLDEAAALANPTHPPSRKGAKA
jgi:tRNA A37 threonylcarbamoyltransferase TsaD